MTTYKKSSVRHYTHYMSPMPGVLEFYPDDIRKIADNNEYVSRGLGDNQFLVITTIPGSASDKPAGYTVQVFDPSFLSCCGPIGNQTESAFRLLPPLG